MSTLPMKSKTKEIIERFPSVDLSKFPLKQPPLDCKLASSRNYLPIRPSPLRQTTMVGEAFGILIPLNFAVDSIFQFDEEIITNAESQISWSSEDDVGNSDCGNNIYNNEDYHDDTDSTDNNTDDEIGVYFNQVDDCVLDDFNSNSNNNINEIAE